MLRLPIFSFLMKSANMPFRRTMLIIHWAVLMTNSGIIIFSLDDTVLYELDRKTVTADLSLPILFPITRHPFSQGNGGSGSLRAQKVLTRRTYHGYF